MSNQLICFIARDWCVIGHRRGGRERVRDRWRVCRCLDMHTDILTALDVGKYGCVILSLNVDEPLTPLSLSVFFCFPPFPASFFFFNLCYIHTRLILLVC